MVNAGPKLTRRQFKDGLFCLNIVEQDDDKLLIDFLMILSHHRLNKSWSRNNTSCYNKQLILAMKPTTKMGLILSHLLS